MRKKQLCALLLTAAMTVGMLPLYGLAADEAQDSISIEVQAEDDSPAVAAAAGEDTAEQPAVKAEESAQETDEQQDLAALPDDAESQDPERYEAERRQEEAAQAASTAPLAEDDMGISVLSGKSYRSFLTGKTYKVRDTVVADGLDVSKWSKDINWTKVKKAGVDFAIIRVGYRGYGNGDMYTDEYYTTNMKNAIKAGIKVGVYIYSQAINGAEARAEAQYCIKRVEGYNLTLPIVMDVEYAEDSGGYTGRMYKANLSRDKLTNMCLAFVDECKSAGYKGMIYANSSMLRDKMNASQISAKAPIWMANYTTNTSYSGDYDYWQYSETGSVSGVDYPVDCNFAFKLPSNVTSVSLNKSKLSMACKNTATLKKTIKPNNSGSASWSSSRTEVAQVSSSGKVTAKSVGTTTVTVKAGDKKDTCKVTVRPRLTAIQTIERKTSSKIKLTWDKKSEADHYRIYRSTSKNGTYKLVGQTKRGGYLDENLKPNTTYYYRLRAAGYQGKTLILSGESAVKSATTTVYTTKVVLSQNAFKLTRTAKQQLKAGLTPTDSKQPIHWSTSNVKVATVTDKGLVHGVEIGKATITATSGSASASCQVTVIPGRVTLNKVAKKTAGTIRVEWNKISSAEYYRVYRATSKNGTYAYIGHTSRLFYNDSKCKSGTRYYYKVRSCVKKDGTKYKGASSNALSAKA